MSGIKISCITKRNLYVRYRDSKDLSHKDHYKKYCKILSSVIRDAKKLYYDSLIKKSTNKVKVTWYIVKTLTHDNHNAKKSITRDINNTQKIAEAFNQYFSTIAEQLIKESTKENSNKGIDPLTYLRLNINKPNNTLKL